MGQSTWADLSAKGVDFFQNLADQYGICIDVQAKVDQIEKAAKQYYDANKAAWESEFQAWMSNNGYDTKLESWSAEAKKNKKQEQKQNPKSNFGYIDPKN